MPLNTSPLNPLLDLYFERIVSATPEQIWTCWTQPEELMPWFTPAPWKTIACDIDLRPGGLFRTAMQSPEGQIFDNTGCYLEISTHRKLVWSNALQPEFRPLSMQPTTPSNGFVFTAIIALTPHSQGCTYRATVLHGNEADCQSHQAMGFQAGWGKALDQLLEHIQIQNPHRL